MSYVRAAKSIVKTSLGIGRVTEEEYHRRLVACSHCPALRNKKTCGACMCLVELKAKDKAESCPIDRPEWRV